MLTIYVKRKKTLNDTSSINTFIISSYVSATRKYPQFFKYFSVFVRHVVIIRLFIYLLQNIVNVIYVYLL